MLLSRLLAAAIRRSGVREHDAPGMPVFPIFMQRQIGGLRVIEPSVRKVYDALANHLKAGHRERLDYRCGRRRAAIRLIPIFLQALTSDSYHQRNFLRRELVAPFLQPLTRHWAARA